MFSTEQIKEDLKIALKQGNLLGQSVLRLVLAEIQNKEKEKRFKLFKQGLDDSKIDEKSKLTEEEVQEVIIQAAKKRKDSISEFEKGNRKDLVEKEKQEMSFLEKYLPEQLSSEEIEQQVKSFIDETGEKDFGKIMKHLSIKNKGRVDGSLLNQIVRSILDKN